MLKGLFLHVFAKVVFVLSTYIIHMYLGKTLLPEEYGIIGVVISIISVNYNFLSNGTRQAMSRLLASKQFDEQNLIRRGILCQAAVAFALTLLNYLGANYISEALNAPEMEGYIKLSAVMIPFTAGYFLCVGTLNGLKLFVIESIIVTIYPLLRLSIIPYVAYLFKDSAAATVMGFMTAAIVCCVGSAGYLFMHRKQLVKRERIVDKKTFLANITNFLLFFSCVTIILNIDMLFVNAYVKNQSHVGFYTGAVNFAKVSYYLLSAIYIVVLPVITQYYANKEIAKALETIKTLGNTIGLLILPIVCIVGATAGNMLAVFYKPEYIYAATATTILMFSQFSIGLFVVLNMCISATGDSRFSSVLSVSITGLNIILCFFLVDILGIEGAAISSCITGFTGCIFSYLKLTKLFSNSIDFTTIKLIIYNFILYYITKKINNMITPVSLISILEFYAIVYFTFIGIMIFTKQVDIKKILKILSKNNESTSL
jgi:Membrane protein involved in the export of O-antigen and teichoic acid